MSKPIKHWFEDNIPGGLSKYLLEISRDIEEIDNAPVRAKTKIDFVKVVEQVLGTLDHLKEVNTDREIIFNFTEVTPEEIEEHWKEPVEE